MFVYCGFYVGSGLCDELITLLGESCRVLGYALAQLVEALRYKSEGRGFESR